MVGQKKTPAKRAYPAKEAQVTQTSFEQEPPWNVAFRPETDKPHRPWYPDGAVRLARYSFDNKEPGNGRRSLRIALGKKTRSQWPRRTLRSQVLADRQRGDRRRL